MKETAAAARPKHRVITATFGTEGEIQRGVLEILPETKIKETGIYEVRIQRQKKHRGFGINRKKNRVVEGVREKSAPCCVKNRKSGL